jgi:predicted dehydrogenase
LTFTPAAAKPWTPRPRSNSLADTSQPAQHTPLRVAVIGGGAFGRNHLRVYRELEQAHPHLVQLVALVDPSPERRAEHAATYNIPTYATVADLISAHPTNEADTQSSTTKAGAPPLSSVERFDSEMWAGTESQFLHAASICVPTIHHASVAEDLLLAGIDILIEKPFAATLAEADRLSALATQHGRILAVGHLERFNPAVTSAAEAITSPMFFEAHRLSIFTPRSLDVDVVLDLMIHDLDIVLSLTNSPVREVRAVGLPVLSHKTDIANVRIEFESGCIANFTASRVSTEQVRKLRLFQPHQYLSLDFARQELLTISVDPAVAAAALAGQLPPSTKAGAPHLASKIWAGTNRNPTSNLSDRPELTSNLPSRSELTSNLSSRPELALNLSSRPTNGSGETPVLAHPSAGLTLKKSTIPKGEPLRLELEDFLAAVRSRTQPRVPAKAGRAALALALEINDQIAAHAKRIKQGIAK